MDGRADRVVVIDSVRRLGGSLLLGGRVAMVARVHVAPSNTSLLNVMQVRHISRFAILQHKHFANSPMLNLRGSVWPSQL
jgi:hypothetical protein